jgi:hypothetical protein
MGKFQGGPGGKKSNRHKLADQRLSERALQQGWPVREELKTKAMKRAEETLDDPNANPRSIAAASRVVISATQTNLASIDTALRARQQEEVDEKIARLQEALDRVMKGGNP